MAQAPPRNLGRMSEIAQVAVRHGFGYFFRRNRLTDLLPGRERLPLDEGSPSERGQHLREMLEELGPTFVKFGQLLSMRPDVLPPDIIAELRGLQDDVKAFPYTEVEATVLEELGLSVEQLFLEFDETPIAAASIGQVHLAVLPNGRRVAVKVQRPEAPRQIEADLSLLYQAARIAKDRVRALDFIDAHALVDEFARSIRQELDYRLEARNADRFRHNFASDPNVSVPRVIWQYTRARVLTLEFLDGTQLADVELLGYGLDERRRLATTVTEAWMTMVFRHGFFHGDPHPANILVFEPDHIGLVDFGLTGTLTDDDLSKATRLFIDIANENVDALPERLADLGVRYPKDLEDRFRSELRELYYRYYGASLAEIDPVQIMREVFALIYSMNLTLPTRFVVLDRAVATLGSLTTELYPDFNVFEVAKPYARGLVVGRFSPGRAMARARRDATNLGRIGMELPYQIHDILEEVRDGEIEIGFSHRGLEDLWHKLDVVANRLSVAVIVAGGLIGSAVLGGFVTTGWQIFGIYWLAAIGFVLSALFGGWLLVGVLRSGRV
jgi:ubiquinone biosynthesis protein